MSTRLLLGTSLVVCLGFAAQGPLQANGWNHGSPQPVRYYYFGTPPVYVAPVPYCPVQGQPVPVYTPPYANPTPAPPSRKETKEPPLGQGSPGGPRVIESRTYSPSDIAPVKHVEVRSQDACKIGFWNVSGADVNLIVDGKTHMIPNNRNLTLTLSRAFTFQVNALEPRSERVPDEKTTHEIVIR
jgi:hypothetical protein